MRDVCTDDVHSFAIVRVNERACLIDVKQGLFVKITLCILVDQGDGVGTEGCLVDVLLLHLCCILSFCLTLQFRSRMTDVVQCFGWGGCSFALHVQQFRVRKRWAAVAVLVAAVQVVAVLVAAKAVGWVVVAPVVVA